MNDIRNDFINAVAQFEQFADKNMPSGQQYAWPCGGETEFLTQAEEVLLSALNEPGIRDAEKITLMSKNGNDDYGYCIVTFGVRLAMLAVRSENQDIFRLSVLPLTAGYSDVDWRDGVTALSIIQDCADRLGINLQTELERMMELGYKEIPLSRVQDVMSVGFRAVGEGKNLRYVNKYSSIW